MTLEQLQYICAIAHHHSLSSAAKELFISQQALSKSIDKLEHELGFSLISSTHKGVSLTKEGVLFVKRAQKILNQIQELYLLNDLPNQQSDLQKDLNLYVTCAFSLLASSQILAYFSKYYPKVQIHITELVNTAIIQTVMQNPDKPILGCFSVIEPYESPINLNDYCNIDLSKVAITNVGEDDIIALCPATSAWAQHDVLDISALDHRSLYTFFLHGIDEVLDYFYHIKPNLAMVSRQVSNDILENIVSSNAICLATRQVLNTLEYNPQIVKLPLSKPLRVVHYFISSNQYQLSEVETVLFEQSRKILSS